MEFLRQSGKELAFLLLFFMNYLFIMNYLLQYIRVIYSVICSLFIYLHLTALNIEAVFSQIGQRTCVFIRNCLLIIIYCNLYVKVHIIKNLCFFTNYLLQLLCESSYNKELAFLLGTIYYNLCVIVQLMRKTISSLNKELLTLQFVNLKWEFITVICTLTT